MKRQLGSICQFLNGGTPNKNVAAYFEGDIPWITSADIVGETAYSARSFITERALEESATNRISKGTVLLVTRTGVGKVAIAGRELCFSQDITAIIPDARCLNGEYLAHFLKTKREHFERYARGATIKGITRDVVANLEISLPPLSEQHRIAAILDQADALRVKRREALAQLDSLAQSIFVEMFGEPVANPKQWKRVRFGELLENIDSGRSPQCLDRPASGDEWGVLKLGAVTRCVYIDGENKALPPKEIPFPDSEVKAGDLLFTRKNTYDLVAACALVQTTRPRMLLPDLIFRLRLRPSAAVNSCYLHRLLTYPTKRKQIQSLASGSSASMPNISKGKLTEALIELPPLPLQQAFSQRIDAIERWKTSVRKGASGFDNLFSSLQHRAFSGEL